MFLTNKAGVTTLFHVHGMYALLLFPVTTMESPSQMFRSLNDATCDVCGEPLTGIINAVKLRCGHNFCDECMKG